MTTALSTRNWSIPEMKAFTGSGIARKIDEILFLAEMKEVLTPAWSSQRPRSLKWPMKFGFTTRAVMAHTPGGIREGSNLTQKHNQSGRRKRDIRSTSV